MIYGLIASSSCYISDIARSLKEDITLKALEKRLSRNLEEFNNAPMILLTNMKPENEEFTKIVNKVYIRRWKIEEYFRFKKQQFGFEKELVRTLNSIRTLNVLLTVYFRNRK